MINARMKQPPLRFQITQIENGWFVALPPDQQTIIMYGQMGQQPEPKIVYCENYEAVIVTLKEAWPVVAT